MPVAWDAIRIPGPPPELALTPAELEAPSAAERFRRRTIHQLDCSGTGEAESAHDRLALIDKAIPHALFDLMVSETSAPDKPTPIDVSPATGRILWRTGLELVRFVSEPARQRAFGLADGQLHLAMNCDPNTSDRESVQAAKQYHLHLLYWTRDELEPLRQGTRLADEHSPFRRRQCLDPLGFLGARIVHAMLRDLPLGIDGARLLDCDDEAVAGGERPLGCVVRLPGWETIGSPAFEGLIRRLHEQMTATAGRLLQAFTGHTEPPAAWQRHRLQPLPEIAAALGSQGWPDSVQVGLQALARGLRDLSPSQVDGLRRASPAMRKHCMTLNQPSYSVNLLADRPNRIDAPLIDADSVYLAVQIKLFSGIGGAGLLQLRGTGGASIPSVRICRGEGRFGAADWLRRASFQRAFALHNAALLEPLTGTRPRPVNRLADLRRGWS
jgi:hypothetical protein